MIMMIENILNSLFQNTVYFALGVLVGYLFSRLLVRVEKKALHDPDYENMPVISMGNSVTRVMLMLVLSVLLFGSGLYVGFRVLQHEYGCLNNYANDLADSLEPRQTATQTYQEKQVRVFEATERLLAGDESARSDLREALTAYRLASIELEEQRAANPYPDPPREVC